MERQVVTLAKGDGFEEVLMALDASADAEYPVVESTGGMWDMGRGGHHNQRGTSPGLSPSPRVTHAGGHHQQGPAGHLPPEPQASPGTPWGEGKCGGVAHPTAPKKAVFPPRN